MERRKRGIRPETIEVGAPLAIGQAEKCCVVCGTRDARLLVLAELRGGEGVTLCGSHALLHARSGKASSTIEELRAAVGERRTMTRRSDSGDELGERLTAAFRRDRRGAERRAG